MKTRIILFYILLICFSIHKTYSQVSPEKLGNLVFTVFKNKDTLTLDTLTISAKQTIEYYSKIDSTIDFLHDNDFYRKHHYRDSLFKNKCKYIMFDTSYLKINWRDATLLTVEHTCKEFIQKAPYRTITINYLEIIFESDKNKYSIFFKGLYNINGIWKLGENMRIRKIEN